MGSTRDIIDEVTHVESHTFSPLPPAQLCRGTSSEPKEPKELGCLTWSVLVSYPRFWNESPRAGDSSPRRDGLVAQKRLEGREKKKRREIKSGGVGDAG
jgi:hypothetical protein